MRELKFRVWTGHTMEYNIMVGHLGAFYCAGMDSEDEASLSPANTRYDDINPVMQFTGLVDCDGNEIYEGDIIYYNNINDNPGSRLVKWNKNQAGFAPFSYTPQYFEKNWKIMGNVFENPELNHAKIKI